MAYPYIVRKDLEDRLSEETVRRIYDDDSDGESDADPIARLCKDASSKVAGYLRGIYDLDIVASNPPNEVIRLTLDVAEAMAVKRHGEYVRRQDWKELMDAAEKDLKALRRGDTRLDVKGLPEPAKNEGGTIRSGDPTDPAPKPKFIADGSGLF